MHAGPGISVHLGKTKIDNVDLVAMNTGTDHEIGGFNITVNEVGRVDKLYTRDLCNCIINRVTNYEPDKFTYHLVCQKQNSFQAEFAVTAIENILQR